MSAVVYAIGAVGVTAVFLGVGYCTIKGRRNTQAHTDIELGNLPASSGGSGNQRPARSNDQSVLAALAAYNYI
jgi:hypothetical protein